MNAARQMNQDVNQLVSCGHADSDLAVSAEEEFISLEDDDQIVNFDSMEMNFEEVIMDKLFQACDVEGSGRVKVADLVIYLRNIVDKHKDGAVSDLVDILDPGQTNAEIEIEAFREGLQTWIQDMKTHREDNSFSIEERNTSSVEQESLLQASLNDSILLSANESLMYGDLNSRLVDSQHHSCRLAEQLQEARATLDCKEEELMKLSTELSHAHLEIRKLKSWTELRQQTESENNELHQRVESLSQSLEDEMEGGRKAGQERGVLEGRLLQAQIQIDDLNTQLGDLVQDSEWLNKQLVASKDELEEMTESCAAFEARLAEKNEREKELIVYVQELTSKNQDMKQHSMEIQEQLIEEQHEIMRLKALSSLPPSGLPPLPPGPANEIEEDSPEPSKVAKKAEGQCQWPPSIRNELQELFQGSPDLPWPLSGKELQESVTVTPDLVSQTGHVSDVKSPTNINSKASSAGAKCGCDSHFDISNEKLRMLVTLLKNFKGENLRLREAFKQMAEQTCIKSKADLSEITRLKQSLGDLEQTTLKLRQEKDRLSQSIDNINRSNAKLSEKLHLTELKLEEHLEQMEATYEELSLERTKSAELQETLTISTKHRRKELQDIWRMVHEYKEEEGLDVESFDFEKIKQEIGDDVERLNEQYNHNETVPQMFEKSESTLNRRLKLPTLKMSSLIDALFLDGSSQFKYKYQDLSTADFDKEKKSTVTDSEPANHQPQEQQPQPTTLPQPTALHCSCIQITQQQNQSIQLQNLSTQLDNQSTQLQNQASSNLQESGLTNIHCVKQPCKKSLEQSTQTEQCSGVHRSKSEDLRGDENSHINSVKFNEDNIFSGKKDTDLKVLLHNQDSASSQDKLTKSVTFQLAEEAPVVARQRVMLHRATSLSSYNSFSSGSWSSLSSDADMLSPVTNGRDMFSSQPLNDDTLTGSDIEAATPTTMPAAMNCRTSLLATTASAPGPSGDASCASRITSTNSTSVTSVTSSSPSSHSSSNGAASPRPASSSDKVASSDDSSKPGLQSLLTNPELLTSHQQRQVQAPVFSPSKTLTSVQEALLRSSASSSASSLTRQPSLRDTILARGASGGGSTLPGGGVTSSSAVASPRLKGLVPSSPPMVRSNHSVSLPVAPIEPSKLAKIRESHLASKKREQMRCRTMKLPELSETSELDTSGSYSSVASVDEDDGERRMPTQASLSEDHAPLSPPRRRSTADDATPTTDFVSPSISDGLLKTLGLQGEPEKEKEEEKEEGDDSIDQLPDKEIESKFASLSLAFKTDKLTVDQRVNIQERARDLAEKNVDRELQGIREAIEVMMELEPSGQVWDVLQRIKQHVQVLENAAARVSSSAEVFGAVQQEKRMCKAMEVMVQYTENLKRLREKEETELTEARKVLSERHGSALNGDFTSSAGGRSMSVCGFGAGGRQMRRRSEIALPRVLGGGGAPSMIPSSAMDPLSRFQSAVASTSMQHAVTATMRRVTMERRTSNVNNPVGKLSAASGGASSEKDCDTSKVRKISVDEEAFRKGYEEGLKAHLSNELTDIREQQNSISKSLENVMDRVDVAEEDTLTPRSLSVESVRQCVSECAKRIVQWDWRAHQHTLKRLAALFIVLIAIICAFGNFSGDSYQLRHVAKPPQ